MHFTVEERQLLDNLKDNHHFEDDEEVGYLMDDMILSEEQMDELFGSPSRRNAVTDPELLWPNQTVPVFISDDFSKSQRSEDS